MYNPNSPVDRHVRPLWLHRAPNFFGAPESAQAHYSSQFDLLKKTIPRSAGPNPFPAGLHHASPDRLQAKVHWTVYQGHQLAKWESQHLATFFCGCLPRFSADCLASFAYPLPFITHITNTSEFQLNKTLQVCCRRRKIFCAVVVRQCTILCELWIVKLYTLQMNFLINMCQEAQKKFKGLCRFNILYFTPGPQIAGDGPEP